MRCGSPLKIVIALIGAINLAGADVVMDPVKDTVSKGKTIFVSCRLSGGDTFANLTFKGQEIAVGTNNDQYQLQKRSDSEYRLYMKSVTSDMAGKYICSSQTNQAEFTLGIEFEFVNFQKQQTLIKDTDGYLKCSVIGYPEPTVKWGKLGQVLPTDRFVHKGNGDLLLIKSVRESDGGVYTCNVEQDRKSDVKNVTVNIKVKAKIDSTPDDLIYSFISNPEKISLACTASGKPTPTVVITKDGQEVKDGDPPVKEPGKYSVSFLTDTESAFGKYVCNATNEINSVQEEFTIEQAVMPAITAISEDKEGLPGEDTSLMCRVSGMPKPTLAWFAYDEGQRVPLGPGAKYAIEEDGTLVIKDTSRGDVGKYECQASNLRGNITETVEITSVREEEDVVAGKRGAGKLLRQNELLVFLLLMASYLLCGLL